MAERSTSVAALIDAGVCAYFIVIELGNRVIGTQIQGLQAVLLRLARPVVTHGADRERAVALACASLAVRCRSRHGQTHPGRLVLRLSARVC